MFNLESPSSSSPRGQEGWTNVTIKVTKAAPDEPLSVAEHGERPQAEMYPGILDHLQQPGFESGRPPGYGCGVIAIMVCGILPLDGP